MNYNVKEDTNTHYIIEIEVPGIPPDELKATLLLDEYTKVAIEHIDKWNEPVALPECYAYSHANAYVEHGMVTVVVHKQETKKPIDIVDLASSGSKTFNYKFENEKNQMFVSGHSIKDEDAYVKPGDYVQFSSGDWELVKNDKESGFYTGSHVSNYQDVRRPRD